MQTRKVLVTAYTRLIDYRAKTYKGTDSDLVADVNRLNSVKNYLTLWHPGQYVIVPLMKGAK